MPSFKILDNLALPEAINEQVQLVPTKRYFKPVLVLTAPLTGETARLVGAEWAFDSAGNPQPFEGSIKLVIELTRAIVSLTGKVAGTVSITSESVKHIAVYRQEKAGMRVRCRVHLPEGKEKLMELLDFLSQLNKEPFQLDITPDSLFTQQRDRGETAGGAPIEYKLRLAKGRKTLVVGNVRTYPAKEGPGFISSWEIKAVMLQNSPAGGQEISDESQVFNSEVDAKAAACEAMLDYVKTLKPDSLDETQAMADTIDWILEQCPALRKDETGKRVDPAPVPTKDEKPAKDKKPGPVVVQ